MSKSLLIIFIKNPVLGKAKTRLAATVGPEKALEIYQILLERTREITSKLPVVKALYYSDFIPENDNWNPSIYQKYMQQGSDLGARMANAFIDGFAQGYQQICIIGSDCYELIEEIITQAFDNLKASEVVLGPSTDGGYYLLGMNHFVPELFQNKDWSTTEVFPQTMQDCKQLNLTVSLLPTLTDVDEEKDLVTISDLH